MGETVRTTIVLPRHLLRRAKIESARADKTLSQLIAEALERTLGAEEVAPAPPQLPIGKYELGITMVPRREEIYAPALGRPASRASVFDLYLVATAQDNGVTRIVTANTRDFEGLAGIDLFNLAALAVE